MRRMVELLSYRIARIKGKPFAHPCDECTVKEKIYLINSEKFRITPYPGSIGESTARCWFFCEMLTQDDQIFKELFKRNMVVPEEILYAVSIGRLQLNKNYTPEILPSERELYGRAIFVPKRKLPIPAK